MKFKGILKCNCVFVYPSPEEAKEENLVEIEGCQQRVTFDDARPIGDLLDRGFGAHSLSNVEYVLQPDVEDHVERIRSHCGFGSSVVLSGAEIHDTTTVAHSSSFPFIPEAITVPDNSLNTIVESNKIEEVAVVQEEMEEEAVDEDANDMEEESDSVMMDDVDICEYDDENADATAAIETIGAPTDTDTLDQPLASIDNVDMKIDNDIEKSNTHTHSSSLQLEEKRIEPAITQVSNTENRNNSGSSSSNKRHTPRKRNKYVRRVHGPILLADEEAFYLCLNGHMIVYEDFNIENISESSPTEVSLDALWSIMLMKNAKFPAKYKAYSFFRDQRFVVRSGMHFGVDFAVYRLLPTQCHSELCAHVVDAIASGGEEMSSRHLSTLTRVMPDVMKLLVLCYVLPAARQHNQTPPSEALMDTVVLSESSQDADKVEAEGSSAVPTTAAEPKIGLSPQPYSFADTIEEKNTGSGSGSGSTSEVGTEDVDCSTYKCLDLLIVRPVTALVRRSSATTKSYSSAVALHQRYRRLSILKKPREFVPNIAVYPRPPSVQQDALTKQSLSPSMISSPDNADGSSGIVQPPAQSQGPFKRRRDPTEVRHKAASKNNMLWAVLASDGEPELSPKSKKRLKKRKWIFKKFGNSKGFVR